MMTSRNKSEQSMVPPIKSWRAKDQTREQLKFMRRTIVTYKLIVLILVHVIIVY